MSKAQQTGGVETTAASDGEQTSGDGSTETSACEPSDDEVFELLSNQRRRFVLHYLRREPVVSVSLSTLSEHVAGWENDADPDELAYSERKSVRNSLHQFHLPKLADAGIVTYDDAAGEISLENPTVVDAYHTVSGGSPSVSRTTCVAGVAAAAVAVVAVAAAAGGVGGAVAWALATLGAVVATTMGLRARQAMGVTEGPPPECRG